MNCLAIDDEPLALNIIKDFSSRIDYINLVATCTNPLEALKILNRNDIDLIFLDIQMPNITGLELIKSIDKTPLFIFTTAYSNFALEGYELNAIDYLLKPFSFDRFFKAVNKAFEINTLRKNKTFSAFIEPESRDHDEFIMIKVEYKTVKVYLNDILYIEGLKDYVKIYIGKKPLLTKNTMKNIEEKLPSGSFIRVHKSFIVAVSKIESIENNRILIGEKLIPVGNQYKMDFNNFMDTKRL
jgi:two-component system, LytTR family, response regulator